MPARRSERRTPRVRYDRMAALLAATGVTLFAFLAGVGTFGPVSAEGATGTGPVPQPHARNVVATRPGLGSLHAGVAVEASTRHEAGTARTAEDVASDPDGSRVAAAVPAASGTGRRIVFDMTDQRVWLIGSDDQVERTYLVSGSVTDNLEPGRYQVYSRSRHAVGVDDSGVMQYFVRFTRGQNAAIGFHDIPVDKGAYVQKTAQLGTPLSHGCIRQWRPDAIRLWDFAPIGTHVTVVA